MSLQRIDKTVRVASLLTLREMCAAASAAGVYRVDGVWRHNRVSVRFSNPDDAGRERPQMAFCPAYPNTSDGEEDNPLVVLDPVGFQGHDPDNAWASFAPVFSAKIPAAAAKPDDQAPTLLELLQATMAAAARAAAAPGTTSAGEVVEAVRLLDRIACEAVEASAYLSGLCAGGEAAARKRAARAARKIRQMTGCSRP